MPESINLARCRSHNEPAKLASGFRFIVLKPVSMHNADRSPGSEYGLLNANLFCVGSILVALTAVASTHWPHGT